MFPENERTAVQGPFPARSGDARRRLSGADLLKLVCDGLGLFMPLEPHHVLGVEPPGLLLQGLGCQILGLGTLPR